MLLVLLFLSFALVFRRLLVKNRLGGTVPLRCAIAIVNYHLRMVVRRVSCFGAKLRAFGQRWRCAFSRDNASEEVLIFFADDRRLFAIFGFLLSLVLLDLLVGEVFHHLGGVGLL